MQTVKTNVITNYDILLVDDDIDEHFLFESSLGEIGLDKKLISFDSGKKALQYLNALCRPDFPSLIILDYDMPVMSGKDILEYLKYNYRFSNIPVIVYSTKMNENMKCDLMELGAIACFRKPQGTTEFKSFLAALAVIYDDKVYW